MALRSVTGPGPDTLTAVPAPPGIQDLYEGFVSVLARWARAAPWRAIAERAGIDVDAVSFHLLCTLGREGPMRMGELAERLQTGPSHVSKLLVRLEDDGYAERATVDDDRRAVLVRLTPAGIAARARLVAAGQAVFAAELEGWDPVDVRALAGLLGRFAREVDPPGD